MKVLIVINAHAGSTSPESAEKSIKRILSRLPKQEHQDVRVLIGRDRDTVKNTIRDNYLTLECVVAAGGDGTVTDIISEILPYKNIKLGILPIGTGNRLASNLGIPFNIKDALRTVLEGEPYAIDVGIINGRYFSLMAGCGLDAEIMADVLPIEKKTMGLMAYFWKALLRVFRMPYAVFEIETDGVYHRYTGIGVVVANAGNLFERFFTLTPDAQLDDGLFDICILASRKRFDYWTTLMQILTHQSAGKNPEGIHHLRGRKITIKSRPKMKAQADGDVIGHTPIEIEALPKAISVMVPQLGSAPHPITDQLQHMTDHLRMVFQDLLRF